MKKIQSTCNLCALACNLDFYVENGKIDRVSPTVDYPVNKGFCCIKGLNLDKQQTKIKARKNPLLRDENGEMKEVSCSISLEILKFIKLSSLGILSSFLLCLKISNVAPKKTKIIAIIINILLNFFIIMSNLPYMYYVLYNTDHNHIHTHKYYVLNNSHQYNLHYILY